MRKFTNCKICNIDLDSIGVHFNAAYCCEEHRKIGKKKDRKKHNINVSNYKKKVFSLPTTDKDIHKIISISSTELSISKRITLKNKINKHKKKLNLKSETVKIKIRRNDGVKISCKTTGISLYMILKIIEYHIDLYNTHYSHSDIIYIKYYKQMFRDVEKSI